MVWLAHLRLAFDKVYAEFLEECPEPMTVPQDTGGSPNKPEPSPPGPSPVKRPRTDVGPATLVKADNLGGAKLMECAMLALPKGLQGKAPARAQVGGGPLPPAPLPP